MSEAVPTPSGAVISQALDIRVDSFGMLPYLMLSIQWLKGGGSDRFLSSDPRLAPGGVPGKAPMAHPVKRCGKCGADIASRMKFCVACGAPTGSTYSLVSAPASGQFALVRLLPDGRTERYPLTHQTVIGRSGADVTVGDDPFLTARHAAVGENAGHFTLSDLGSTNGTYVRIRGEVELRPGDYLMIGGQVFRFAL